MKCKCSESCEHYVPNSSRTGFHKNCAKRVGAWKDRDVGEALEYARRLDVRRGTLSYVVSRTDVAQAAIEKRKEVAERERKEREEAAAERARSNKKRRRKG